MRVSARVHGWGSSCFCGGINPVSRMFKVFSCCRRCVNFGHSSRRCCKFPCGASGVGGDVFHSCGGGCSVC